jgi:hypothetical protein
MKRSTSRTSLQTLADLVYRGALHERISMKSLRIMTP